MAPFGSNTWQTDQVLEETTGFVRTFTLNRPKQLNALSFEMISRLLELFYACKSDPSVKLIILKGKGRAFCAGGDVAAVVRDIHEGNWKSGAELFWKEYTLNYLMATYSKSQVSILNGLVMGGGAGVSVHGRFRIATENSVFAMPETALGLFPDVGASYYLSRLPGFFGEYLGLTGARLDGAEMLACGLATHFVPSEKLSLLEEALHKVDSADPTLISSVINEFSQFPSLKEKSAYNRLDIIDRCFSRGIIEEIISVLESEAVESKDDWISSTIQSLKKASPISLKISLRSIREGRLQGVGQGLVREYRMVCCVVKGEVSKDFSEGCRALLLDKDKNPKWEPSKLELISDNMVERYFSKLDDDDWEDLKLPWRSNLPVSILNGIVMGGGAGVSVHGRFRIATENTVFAMPETALGFFPDIGASYILSRLPGFFGEYLGLTGAKLDGAEIFACGLATTHFVPSEVDSADPTVMSSIINEFSEFLSLKAKSVYNRLDTIDRCFSRRTIEEIITALESEAAETKDDWITLIIQSLKKASPTSLKISLRLIREGRLQGVGQCLVHEYRMVCCVMKGEVSKDFFEGCQAILLD